MHVRLEVDGIAHDVRIERADDGTTTIIVDDQTFPLEARQPSAVTDNCVDIMIDGHTFEVQRRALDVVHVNEVEHGFDVQEIISSGTGAAIGPGGASVRPPMPGKIVGLHVHEGQIVEAGDVLLVLEAMKMQNEVNSPARARVDKVQTKIGDNVDTGDILLVLVPADDEAITPTAKEVPA